MSSTNIPIVRQNDLAEPATSAKLPTLVPVTVIILTFNEERNISDCVRSLDWADEVMVVDSGSIDATTAIAVETRPDLRVFQHAFKDFGDQRNWALDKTSPRNSWVLFLDADEQIGRAHV